MKEVLMGGRIIKQGEVIPWRLSDPAEDTLWGRPMKPPLEARLLSGELVLPRSLQHQFTSWLNSEGHRYELKLDSVRRMSMQVQVCTKRSGSVYLLGWVSTRPDYWTGSQELLEMFYDSCPLEQGADERNPLDNDEGNDMSEKNSAALLRNDTKTVKVKFLGDNTKAYTYVTHLELAVGDTVVVPYTQGGIDSLGLAVIDEVHDELMIEPRANMNFKWVMQKVDQTDYEAQMAKNKVIEDTVREAYRANARQSFQASMLAGLPADKQAELLQLTSK